MTDLILFMLSSIGLTLIITESMIFKPIRDLCEKRCYELIAYGIGCNQCVGFYSGCFCGWLFFSGFWHILGCGFAGSVLAPMYVTLFEFISSKIGFEIGEPDVGPITSEKST